MRRIVLFSLLSTWSIADSNAPSAWQERAAQDVHNQWRQAGDQVRQIQQKALDSVLRQTGPLRGPASQRNQDGPGATDRKRPEFPEGGDSI